MPLAAETCVATHVGDRSEQQDRVAVFRHPSRAGLLLAVVADGMGGHIGGAMAAEQVVLRARQNFEDFMPRHETAEQLLGGVIDEAHRMMRLTRFTTGQDPHSTAALLLLQPGRASWAHCGDSRLYHVRGKRVLFRSEDHSLVGELRRKGRIDDEVALLHPRRNVLLSCLGSELEPRVDHGHAAPLQAGDVFLLCSDGLWSCVPEGELAVLLHALPPREAAAALIDLARERARGVSDNISLAIVKLVAAAARPAPFPPRVRERQNYNK